MDEGGNDQSDCCRFGPSGKETGCRLPLFAAFAALAFHSSL